MVILNERLNIVYESRVDNIVSVNSSFDKGVLKVAYHGKNRNKSCITKEVFEKCIYTIYNCPVVCNYNRETDSIGAHDVDVVKNEKGMKLVNITQPVGVVPESAKYWWETVTEEDGGVHEYLCTEIILWKRQEAYTKIKENKITSESMEIKVNGGKTIDGYFHIDSFEFTAFCLLESAEPCYESACIEVFSLSGFQSEYSRMMEDFKKHFSKVNSSTEVDIDNRQNLLKGGKNSLDENKIKLLSEYGLTAEALDFDISELTVEDLRVRLEDMKQSTTNDEGVSGESGEQSANDGETDPNENAESQTNGDDEEFALVGQRISELSKALEKITFEHPTWGKVSKYWYADHEDELLIVYYWDVEEDWKLYGFNYTVSGDNVTVNFDSKKRKKFTIVDFDEGSAGFDCKRSFEAFGKTIETSQNAAFLAEQEKATERYNQLSATVNDLQSELESLREFKRVKTGEERICAEEELFSRFAELDGIEAFEALRSDCSEMSLEDIESKCFEIKGRSTTTNFSANKQKSTRLVVEKQKNDNEPYGGLFVQYPPTNI